MPSGCGRKSLISWSRCGREGARRELRLGIIAPVGICYPPAITAGRVRKKQCATGYAKESSPMKMLSALRATLVALAAFAGTALSSTAHADDGTVSLVIY